MKKSDLENKNMFTYVGLEYFWAEIDDKIKIFHPNASPLCAYLLVPREAVVDEGKEIKKEHIIKILIDHFTIKIDEHTPLNWDHETFP